MTIMTLLTLNLSIFIYMRYIYLSPIIEPDIYLMSWYVALYTLSDMDPLLHHVDICHLETLDFT